MVGTWSLPLALAKVGFLCVVVVALSVVVVVLLVVVAALSVARSLASAAVALAVSRLVVSVLGCSGAVPQSFRQRGHRPRLWSVPSLSDQSSADLGFQDHGRIGAAPEQFVPERHLCR